MVERDERAVALLLRRPSTRAAPRIRQHLLHALVHLAELEAQLQLQC